MGKTLRVLLVDDNPDDRALVTRELKREFDGVEVRAEIEMEGLRAALEEADFELVITDYQLRWTDGLSVLRMVRERLPDMPVIMFTATGSEEIAVEAMKAGLNDYVLKSQKHLPRLLASVLISLQQAETRRAIKQAEARYQSVVRLARDAMITTDMEGGIVSHNPQADAMFRLEEGDGAGPKSIVELVAPEDRERLREGLKQAREAAGLQSAEYSFQAADDRAFSGEMGASLVVDASGEPSSLVFMIRDTTEIREVEKALAQSRARFRKLAEDALALALWVSGDARSGPPPDLKMES